MYRIFYMAMTTLSPQPNILNTENDLNQTHANSNLANIRAPKTRPIKKSWILVVLGMIVPVKHYQIKWDVHLINSEYQAR